MPWSHRHFHHKHPHVQTTSLLVFLLWTSSEKYVLSFWCSFASLERRREQLWNGRYRLRSRRYCVWRGLCTRHQEYALYHLWACSYRSFQNQIRRVDHCLPSTHTDITFDIWFCWDLCRVYPEVDGINSLSRHLNIYTCVSLHYLMIKRRTRVHT